MPLRPKINPAEEPSSLFAYGSLMDGSLRDSLLHRRVETVAAELEGYERRRGQHFYLIRQGDVRTQGLLLLNLDAADFAILDCYEEVPRLYTREIAEVTGSHGLRLRCWLYLPTARLTGRRRSR